MAQPVRFSADRTGIESPKSLGGGPFALVAPLVLGLAVAALDSCSTRSAAIAFTRPSSLRAVAEPHAARASELSQSSSKARKQQVQDETLPLSVFNSATARAVSSRVPAAARRTLSSCNLPRNLARRLC